MKKSFISSCALLSVPVLFFFPDVMDRGSPRFGQAIVLFDLIFAMVYLPF
jgi:hypothetical protein